MILPHYRCLMCMAMLIPVIAFITMIFVGETFPVAIFRSMVVLMVLFLIYKYWRRPWRMIQNTGSLRNYFSSAAKLLRPVATPLRRDLFGLPDVEEGTDGLVSGKGSLQKPRCMSRLGSYDHGISKIGQPLKMKHSTYIRLDEELGRGASKTVWLAVDLTNDKRVAWSMVHTAHQSKKENERAVSELSLLMSHSPYRNKVEGIRPAEGTIEAGQERLVRLLDMHPSDTHLHIITELIDGGNLRRWSAQNGLVQGRELEYQDIDDLCKVANNISHGLAWLHQHKIIHRDVRPENILVKLFPGSDSTRIKSAVLADMGLFAFSPEHLSDKLSIAGRDEYLSPEIVKQMVYDDTAMGLFDITFTAIYTNKVDVWMLGLSIAEIPTNQLPSVNIHRCSCFEQYTSALEQRIDSTLRIMGYEAHPLHNFLRNALVVNPVYRWDSRDLWEVLQRGSGIPNAMKEFGRKFNSCGGRDSSSSTVSLPR
eukprot:GEMP01013572.1.p1 GENE.GEMP01013572.1~~GEMP01013572.1.p1  ORF type:complete len:480 (+),score=64.35 GEMP01013572.1:234-1673(+)